MKMKRSFVFLVVLLTISILFSCSNALNVGYVKTGSDADSNNGLASLSIGLGEITASRTISPNDWGTDAASVLIYVLTDDSSTVNKTLDYAKLKAGSAQVSLAAQSWNLTLTAYVANGANADTNKPVLQATATADLSSGSTSVAFNMKAVTSGTTATGKTDIKLVFYKTANFSSVKYGLYTGSDASAALVTGVTEETKNAAECAVVNSSTNQYSITYTNTTAPVGSTNYFGAKFYDATGNLLTAYFDKVIIDGGNTSSKTITLGNVFNTIPDNPINLSVTSKTFNDTDADGDSDAQLLTSTDTVKDLYNVAFVWDDNSDNETGFELIITDTTAIPTTDYTLTSSSVVGATAGSLISGSLAAGSTGCTVALSTGHTYTAKIRAVNTFTQATDIDYRACTDSVINLFTVTYNLASGYVKYGANDEDKTGATVLAYVSPYSKSTAIQSFMGDTSNVPGVGRENYTFSYWKDASDAQVANIVENITV